MTTSKKTFYRTARLYRLAESTGPYIIPRLSPEETAELEKLAAEDKQMSLPHTDENGIERPGVRRPTLVPSFLNRKAVTAALLDAGWTVTTEGVKLLAVSPLNRKYRVYPQDLRIVSRDGGPTAQYRWTTWNLFLRFLSCPVARQPFALAAARQ